MSTSLDRQIDERRARLSRLVGQGPAQSSTRGINHVAVFARDLDATADFYIKIMGMPITFVTSNRDEPRSTHMNVDIGEGVGISFFDFPHVERLQATAPEGAGGVMHLAIPVSADRFGEIEARLRERGVAFRRIGDSVYFKDPNGLTLELMVG